MPRLAGVYTPHCVPPRHCPLHGEVTAIPPIVWGWVGTFIHPPLCKYYTECNSKFCKPVANQISISTTDLILYLEHFSLEISNLSVSILDNPVVLKMK